MLIGFLYGLAATMIWGMVYIVPLLIPSYDPLLIALTRYTIFGIFSIGLAFKDRQILRTLTKNDWWVAASLGIVGSLGYYWILSEAVVRAGAPVAGAFSAMIPVVASIVANATEKNQRDVLPWERLILPLSLIILGMGLLNYSEFEHFVKGGITNSDDFYSGIFLAFISLFIWTWYPIRNARWLISHPRVTSKSWTTAQGLMLLVPSSVGLTIFVNNSPNVFPGKDFSSFLVWILFLGIISSWLGTLLWNQMSKRLPALLTGQMLIFETIFAVIYAHVIRGVLPSMLMIAGMGFLITGILFATIRFQKNKIT